MDSPPINLHEEIIKRCMDHDEIAQYELYQLYHKAMYNTALRIVGDREEAEDVLQEAFISAFNNIHSYRGDATFGAWLKRITVNKALTVIRKKEREAVMLADVDQADQVEESTVESDYSVAEVKEAIMKLPTGFRTVLTLYLLEGYDHKEISQIMEIAESTSKTQYKRAKEKLKSELMNNKKYG